MIRRESGGRNGCGSGSRSKSRGGHRSRSRGKGKGGSGGGRRSLDTGVIETTVLTNERFALVAHGLAGKFQQAPIITGTLVKVAKALKSVTGIKMRFAPGGDGAFSVNVLAAIGVSTGNIGRDRRRFPGGSYGG